MMALRDSVKVEDVRLKRKLLYAYAKLKAIRNLRSRPVRYAPVSQHESTEATSVATISRQDLG